MTDPSGKQITAPQFTATQTLSPSQQAIFDKTQAAQGNLAGLAQDQSARLSSMLATPFKFDNQDAADWAYDLASSRILPQQEQARAALDRQLINRGLRPGTAAYAAEMKRMDQANNDQMNQLALNGRGQAFQEAAFTRANPINETTALLSGSQITQPNQSFTSTPQSQVAGVDYSGLVNQNFQNESRNYQAGMGGMFSLGGALLGGAAQYGLPLLKGRR
ncbi:hypothetical protein [Nitrobacter vulgaris]|nr:hypothetical protein [Nitrobacter vulgaris]